MPATRGRFGDARPRERIRALVATALVQAALALALLTGLKVPISRAGDAVEQLIDVRLSPPPPPPVLTKPRPLKAAPDRAPAPRSLTAPGASPGPRVRSVAPVVARPAPPVPAAAGGTGAGASAGKGSGGGQGGEGIGDEGGTDLVQIAGAILPSDYPRNLRARGIGGRVGIAFTVGASGRVTACSVTRSSGVPELDALTCRLIRERFVYRPSTDSRGRPIADEVEGEHDWVAAGRD